MDNIECTSIIIIGCGPTGALLSALLGRAHVPNIVLEKEPAITTDPRGIALDEDGIRALQSVGVYDQVYSTIGRSMGRFNFVGGEHQVLEMKPFLRMDNGTSEGGTGHVGFICHKQPFLEAALRGAMQRNDSSTLRVGCTVVEIEEGENSVFVTYQDEKGAERKVKGKYLVGADGKTGFTRKKYLEPQGVKMEQVSNTSYAATWVALNWKMTLPTPKTHPNFPLWQLGYTPEQVYDAFFPAEFRFLCNPKRPAVAGRFGLPEDRLWRFEFEVQPGEDGTELAGPEWIRKLVFPYVKHKGSRYGLKHDISYPDDCITILRSRPFHFSARSCNVWSLNRVLLCGDSAHVFPPFGGQGIASGFRDAVGLAWRLQLCAGNSSSPLSASNSNLPKSSSSSPSSENESFHESAFKAWYTERKQQFNRSLAATIRNGEMVTESSWIKITVRDWTLWFMQMIPSWRRWLEMGPRAEGLTKYKADPEGVVVSFLPDVGGGKNWVQSYVVPQTSSGWKEEVRTVHFSDDVIWREEKIGLLQLVILPRDDGEVEEARSELRNIGIEDLSEGNLRHGEATFIIHKLSGAAEETTNYNSIADTLASQSPTNTDVYRIASPEVFGASRLCANRPKPRYYDPYRMSKEVNGAKYIILRPDRFVFAACKDIVELENAIKRIGGVLRGETAADHTAVEGGERRREAKL